MKNAMTLIAGLVLIALASVPFLVAHQLEERVGRRSRERQGQPMMKRKTPSMSAINRSDREEPETGPTATAAPSAADTSGDSVRPGSSDVEAVGRPATYFGCLRRAGSRVAKSEELELRTPTGSRTVWTDPEGEFTFVVAADQYPAELLDGAVELYRIERSPEVPVYLNLEFLTPTKRFNGLIQPELIAAEHFEDGRISLHVTGGTSLPLDSQLLTSLNAGVDRRIAAGREYVRPGRELGEVATGSREFHSGRYFVSVFWRPTSASPAQLRQVEALLPDGVPDVIEVRRPVYLGRRAHEREEAASIAAFYRQALGEAQIARDFLLYLGWSVRGRGGDSPPKGSGWRHVEGLWKNEGRLAALKNSEFFKANHGLAQKPFHLKKWRELLDEDLGRRWRPYLDSSSVPFPDKYPRSAAALPSLFNEIWKLYKVESRLIYDAIGATPSPRDLYDHDWGPDEERRQVFGRINNIWKAIKADVPLTNP